MIEVTNYTFTCSNNLVVCVAHMNNGKYVVAKAKCHAEDDFNETAGRNLVKARADVKVANIAAKAAARALDEIEAARKEILKKHCGAHREALVASAAQVDAMLELNDLLNKLK